MLIEFNGYVFTPKIIFFITLIGLLIFEQFFYFIKGSYIYRYGVKIKKTKLKEIPWEIILKKHSNLSIKSNMDKKEVYIYYISSQLGFKLIRFFVAQIQYDNEQNILFNIKMGHFLFISIILCSISIIGESIQSALYSFLLIWLFLYFEYKELYNKIWDVIEKNNIVKEINTSYNNHIFSPATYIRKLIISTHCLFICNCIIASCDFGKNGNTAGAISSFATSFLFWITIYNYLKNNNYKSYHIGPFIFFALFLILTTTYIIVVFHSGKLL